MDKRPGLRFLKGLSPGGLLEAITILRPRRWPKGSGKIILSFDDGPEAVSGHLLSVLRRRGVKATFCFIGANVAKSPEIARAAHIDGHEIANHTQRHPRPLFAPDDLDREIRDADQQISRAIGVEGYRSRLFRPPYGLVTPAVARSGEAAARELAYLTFFVDDSSAEAKAGPSVIERIKKLLLRDRGGAIVFHEARHSPFRHPPSKAWLPDEIDGFIVWARENGFEFVGYPHRTAESG